MSEHKFSQFFHEQEKVKHRAVGIQHRSFQSRFRGGKQGGFGDVHGKLLPGLQHKEGRRLTPTGRLYFSLFFLNPALKDAALSLNLILKRRALAVVLLLHKCVTLDDTNLPKKKEKKGVADIYLFCAPIPHSSSGKFALGSTGDFLKRSQGDH